MDDLFLFKKFSFFDLELILFLVTTHGFLISTIHKSASFPFWRLPLSISRIFAGFDVMEAINFVLSYYIQNSRESIKSEEFVSKISDLERALEEQEKAVEVLNKK